MQDQITLVLNTIIVSIDRWSRVRKTMYLPNERMVNVILIFAVGFDFLESLFC